MALKSLGYRNLASAVVLGGAILGFIATAAFAQAPAGGVSIGPGGRIVTGQLYFRQYCAECHGLDGKGTGPVAEALKKSPADLTLLSKKHGGVFPQKYVEDTVSGAEVVKAHGTREMPIWGWAFRTRQGALTGAVSSPPLTPQQVKTKIDMLTAYVKSIQAK